MTTEYRKYLQSVQWAEIRNDLYANRGRRCEQCGSGKNIQIHHRNYKRIFNEEPGDLIILCKKCHNKEHGLSGKKHKKKKKKQNKRLKALRKLEHKWCSKAWNQRQQLKDY